MSEFYDRAFKAGFGATIAVFVALNMFSYILAAKRYDELINQPISWAPGPRFPAWGVPFSWEGNNLNYGRDRIVSDLMGVADGLVLNFFTIAACGFLVGLIVRYLARRYE